MIARLGWFWVRLPTLLGLAASAALTTDYLSDVSTYCGDGSGCAAVRQSGFGYLTLGTVGVPLPLLGLLGFALLFGCTLLPLPEQRRRLALPLAGMGAFIGVGLLLLQALVIRKFCVGCVIANLSAILAGGAVFWLLRRREGRAREPEVAGYGLAVWAWLTLAGLCVLVPIAWPRVKLAPPVPPAIAALYVPGKPTIVEFVDFECPHCRHLHKTLSPLVTRAQGNLVIVRRHVPLSMHPHARFAAQAAICAEGMPSAEALADFLFTTPDLSEKSIRRHVVSLKFNTREFDACLSGPSSVARLNADRALFDSAKVRGLPTTYIGAWQNSGVASEEAYEDALTRAQTEEGSRGLSGTAFAALCALLLAVLVWAGKERATRAMSA